MAHKRRIFILLGSLMGLMLTQVFVIAQDKGTPDPTSATDYPIATLTTTPVPTVTQAIKLGDRIEIHFDPNKTEQRLYIFNGRANDAVSITLSMVDGSLPSTELVLPNQRSIRLDREDVDGNTIRWALRYYVLPSDGEYQIRMYAFGETGTAVLQLAKATSIPIDFFTLIQGTLSDAQDAIAYQFTGKSGEQITVDVDANGFMPIIELYCTRRDKCNGSLSSSGGIYNQSLVYSLPRDDNYILILRMNNIGGTFKLAVSPLQPTLIGYGDTVEADFSASTVIQQYSFQAHFGDIVQIHVKGDGKIDTQLALWQAINLITSDDDSGNNLDPEIINTMLYGDGSYTIVLRPYTLGDSGKVTLSLDHNPIPSLDNGSQVLNLTPKFASMVATFTGMARENVRLSIRTVAGGSSQGTQIEVRQNGLDIMTASATGNESSSVEFITPKDGKVEIYLTGDAATELSIERLGK